jgi:hypothetical protein
LAVTLLAEVSVTVQVFVPEQAPDQPAKVNPVAGVAVKLTLLPVPKFAVQVWPQLIPLGSLLTMPLPFPARVTVRDDCKGCGLPVTPTHPDHSRTADNAKTTAKHRTRPAMIKAKLLVSTSFDDSMV